MRQTRQKQLVQDIVMGRKDHPTADQVYLEARSLDGKISRGTVYRDLSQLSQNGTIRQVKVPGPDRYDYRLAPHYHLLCKKCGMVVDADIPYSEELDKEVRKKSGYAIDLHRTVFEGTCPSCLKKQGDVN